MDRLASTLTVVAFALLLTFSAEANAQTRRVCSASIPRVGHAEFWREPPNTIPTMRAETGPFVSDLTLIPAYRRWSGYEPHESQRGTWSTVFFEGTYFADAPLMSMTGLEIQWPLIDGPDGLVRHYSVTVLAMGLELNTVVEGGEEDTGSQLLFLSFSSGKFQERDPIEFNREQARSFRRYFINEERRFFVDLTDLDRGVLMGRITVSARPLQSYGLGQLNDLLETKTREGRC